MLLRASINTVFPQCLNRIVQSSLLCFLRSWKPSH